MSNDLLKNVSDDELKKQYSKCCDDLDVVEDQIRDILMESDRRKVEKEGRDFITKEVLEVLIKKWTDAFNDRASNPEIDPTRHAAMEAYRECIADVRDLIHK